MEPAPAQRLGARLGLHPVAGEHIRTAHDQFAHGVGRDVAVVVVDDAGVDMHRDAADRPGPRADVLGVEDGHQGSGLGHAEALGEGHASLAHEVDDREGDGRPAAHGETQRRQVEGVKVGHLCESGPHGRHHELNRDVVVGHRLQRRSRLERRHDDAGAADVEQRQGVYSQPADVEHRRHRDCDVLAPQADVGAEDVDRVP